MSRPETRFGPRSVTHGLTKRLRSRYGAGPGHAVLLALSFAVAAYAGARLLEHAAPWWMLLVWFVGAAVVHDLVLLPLYALADRALRALFRTRHADRTGHTDRVRHVSHLRVPAALSLLLLLVHAPEITAVRGAHYEAATGLDAGVFLGRWLLITAALFAVSALWLAARLVLGRPGTRSRPLLVGRAVRPAGDDGPTSCE